jgi:hypothetical protein
MHDICISVVKVDNSVTGIERSARHHRLSALGPRLINGSAAEGVGATRQCDMTKSGKQSVRERVIESDENRQLVVEIY